MPLRIILVVKQTKTQNMKLLLPSLLDGVKSEAMVREITARITPRTCIDVLILPGQNIRGDYQTKLEVSWLLFK